MKKTSSPEFAGDRDAADESASPMSRFLDLTKNLLKVSRSDLEKETRRYEDEKSSSPRRKPLSSR